MVPVQPSANAGSGDVVTSKAQIERGAGQVVENRTWPGTVARRLPPSAETRKGGKTNELEIVS